MRRIAVLLALAVGALFLSSCRGVDASDPFHPTVVNPSTYTKYGCP